VRPETTLIADAVETEAHVNEAALLSDALETERLLGSGKWVDPWGPTGPEKFAKDARPLLSLVRNVHRAAVLACRVQATKTLLTRCWAEGFETVEVGGQYRDMVKALPTIRDRDIFPPYERTRWPTIWRVIEALGGHLCGSTDTAQAKYPFLQGNYKPGDEHSIAYRDAWRPA
jgi:hypothetical protein